MPALLRVLIIEDSPDDAELILREIRREGFEVRGLRVDTADDLRRALDESEWDLIVSDYSLPSFSGLEALQSVMASGLDVPFIVVSGVMTEDAAVAAMKAGAVDYVLKDKLARLGPAVSRELREAAQRREQRRVQAELEALRRRETDARARAALEAGFLDEASQALATSLDYGATLQTLAELAVTRLSEWALVEVPEAGELQPRRLAVAHANPEQAPLLAELAERAEASLHALFGTESVLERGVPEVRAELGRRPPRGPEEDARRLLRLAPEASAVFPLVAEGRVLGTLTIGRSTGGAFTAEELALAKELARRGSLAVENAVLYRAAREAIAAREEFLSIASHELKTPLTVLLLQLERARRPALQNPDGHALNGHGESLDQAIRQARRMANLIDSMLDVSRATAGRLVLQPEKVDLVEVVSLVIERLRAAAEAAGSRLVIASAGPLTGLWDRLRLEQVVTNLLSNAIKYGQGQPIELILGGDGERARLSVRDHGIGIRARDLARIFERFERAVSPRNYGGLGLGLFISKQIAEAHGGTIEVESVPGAGSTFTVHLPRAPRPTAEAPATP